jgi:hypothetical protein
MNAYRILVGKPEVKISLQRPRHVWEDNIKMNLRELGWCGINWIYQAQDRGKCSALVNRVMNLRIP